MKCKQITPTNKIISTMTPQMHHTTSDRLLHTFAISLFNTKCTVTTSSNVDLHPHQARNATLTHPEVYVITHQPLSPPPTLSQTKLLIKNQRYSGAWAQARSLKMGKERLHPEFLVFWEFQGSTRSLARDGQAKVEQLHGGATSFWRTVQNTLQVFRHISE